jgi:autotransporter translocation and assembly factor TamB
VSDKIDAQIIAVADRARLLDARANIPASLDELFANPRALRDKPLTADATSNAPAATMLGLFGRTEVTGGTVEGTAKVTGTVGAPQAVAKIVGTGIQVPPGPGYKPIQTVQKITVDATWKDRKGALTVDAVEDRGSLKLVAQVSPDALQAASVSLTSKNFDLLPILAFAPGPAGGAAGRLDARLEVRGLDPRTAQIAGEAHLRDGRIPLAPTVGTLRRANIDVLIKGREVAVTVDGRLGDGTVKGNGNVSLDGAAPTGGDLKLTLRKVSPIGVIEPLVDADVTVAMRREADHWRADVSVTNGYIKVPSDRSQALSQPGAPPDMRFENTRRITRRPLDRGQPARPALIARIVIARTKIESDELRGTIRGKITVTADGETVGVVGAIEADRGDLDLFGRRYRVDRAGVRFDGTTDPILDVQIVHDFPEVTTITQVRGRASKPRLIMRSEPASYTQGQLLGFLLGGEPSGDPGSARDRATAAGTSFVANKIGGYVKSFLPIDLDVLRYEHATASSSAAVTVGTWLRHDLFLAYRRHLEARPDENAGEGELEYWLGKRVVVEGVVGDRNRDSVDLLWRKRY